MRCKPACSRPIQQIASFLWELRFRVFVSLAQRHILTSRVEMQHEGVSGSEVGVQRAYTKSISTDLLELTEDTGSGSSFKKNHTEPVTR